MAVEASLLNHINFCPVKYSSKAQIGFLARESMKKVALLPKVLHRKLQMEDLRMTEELMVYVT